MKGIGPLTWAAAACVCVQAAPCFAQDQQGPPIEYGSAADLSNVHRIYIDTGPDMDDHDNIARIVLRELPMLSVTPRPQDAEVILYFRSSDATFYAGSYTYGSSTTNANAYATGPRSVAGSSSTTSSGFTTADYATVVAGSGKVFRVTPQGSIRMIATFEGSKRKGTIWKQPRTKFAEKFIDAYKAGNQGMVTNAQPLPAEPVAQPWTPH